VGDERRELIEELHQYYEGGTLRVLVGAGVSMASQLPGWDELNLGLTGAVIERDLVERSGNGESRYMRDLVGTEALDGVAREVYRRIGRDAAADFAWRRLGDKVFRTVLAQKLYPRPAVSLRVRGTQKQLAAMALARPRSDLLFTTNYDPLLERAIAELRGAPEEWARHRYPTSGKQRARATPRVNHLHGWVDERGEVGGTLVLTETSYLGLFADRRARPNLDLKKLLMGNAPLLVIGMSLADPNLRRLLDRRRVERMLDANNAIHVVMVGGGGPADDQINQYWTGTWNINPIWLPDFGYIPHLLRQVQWGWSGDALPWFSVAKTWVDERVGAHRFTDEWQRRANVSLRTLVRHIRAYFALPTDEMITTSLFLPDELDGVPVVQKTATSRDRRSGDDARAHARRRSLRLTPDDDVEGVAGVAFRYGTSSDATNNHPSINYNFTARKVRDWDRAFNMRDWRSILAVPVSDGEEWLPFAVLTLTSNKPDPFWRRLGDRELDELPVLKALMRRVCKELVAHHGL
jgi:hypothetical protein